MSGSRILVIEDDAIQAFHLQAMLDQLGYRVVGLGATGADAIRLALSLHPDAILMDINLRGEMNGIQAVAEIHRQAHIPVVYLTAYTDDALIQEAKTADVYAFLAKPVRDRDLRASLEMTLYKYSVEKRIENLNGVLRAIREVNQLITREKDPQRLLDEARRILLQTRSFRTVWFFQPGEGQPLGVEGRFGEFLRQNAPDELADWSEGLHSGRTACIPMLHNQVSYGYLCVLAEPQQSGWPANEFDPEEYDLLREVAEDLAYGMNSIREEEARKQAEQALREERDRFNKIAVTAPGMIYSMQRTVDGRDWMPYASAKSVEVLGLKPDEIGENISRVFESVYPEDIDQINADTDRSLREMSRSHTRFRYNHPARGEVWLESDSTPVREEDGSVTWHGFVIDITDRIRSEQSLRESEERFSKVFQASPNAIGISRLSDSRYIDVNPSWETLTGYTRAETVGQQVLLVNTWLDLEDRKGFFEILNRQGFVNSYVYQLITKTGDVRQVSMSGTIIELEGEQCLLTITVDITLQHQTEQVIRESEAHYRLLAENMDDMVWLMDLDLNVVYTSPSVYRLRGLTLEDMNAFALDQHLTPESYQRAVELYDEVLGPYWNHQPLQQFSSSIWLEFYRIDGTTFWCDTSFTLILDDNGRPTNILAVGRDITLRKEAEERLQASEEKYRGLLESLDGVIAAVDRDGYFLYMNEVAAGQLAGNPSYFIGKHMRELFPEPVASRQLGSIQKVLDENRGLTFETESIVAGQPRWYRTSIQPIRGDDGRPIYGLINSTEITELKIAQAELQELNRTLELRVQDRTSELSDLYNHAPCGYHSLDADGRFVMINDTELGWLGYTREEVVGKMMFGELLTVETRKNFEDNFGKFKDHKNFSSMEAWIRRKNGTVFPILINSIAVSDEEGRFLIGRTTTIDMTQLKKAEQALRLSEARLRQNRDELSAVNIELEKAARLKDEFLASMSHELRTPLTGILGLSQVLLMDTYGTLNEKQLSALENIEMSGKHLLELINDILDLSKIEAGKLSLNFEDMSLGDICQGSLQLVRGMAQQRNQTVQYTIEPERIFIRVDGRRLKQVLVNLLSNAVKFSPEGGQIGLEVKGDAARGVVQITIWDQGIGISAEDLPRLFQPFVQLDSSLARQYSGTGLGLSLVRRMVEMHGGSIGVESQPGTGSRFEVRLPWAGQQSPARGSSALIRLPGLDEEAVEAESERLADQPGAVQGGEQGWDIPEASSGRVMIVDDYEVTIEMLSAFLESKNFEVWAARSGRQMLDDVAEARPDIILLDIQMPGMDGLETARILRANSAKSLATIPIIAITALVMPNDRERCLAAGIDAYLSKPFYFPELLETIEKLIAH